MNAWDMITAKGDPCLIDTGIFTRYALKSHANYVNFCCYELPLQNCKIILTIKVVTSKK